MKEQIKLKEVLIEAYALGYLAHVLDVYADLDPLKYESIPLNDNCFLNLMDENGLISLRKNTILKNRQQDFDKCVNSYDLGYHDSMFGEVRKVSIPDKRDGRKVWTYPIEISKLTQTRGGIQ
jgi:hypothetical protein